MIKKIALYGCICCLLASCSKKQVLPENYFFTTELTKADSLKGVLSPELLWKFGRVSEVLLSPNATSILYIVKRYSFAENKGNAEIFSTSANGTETQQLTYTTVSETNIKWIDNGKSIAFLAPSDNGSMQIWTMLANGTQKSQLSHIDGDVESFAFAPDEKHLMYTLRVKTDSSTTDQYPDLPKTSGRVFTNLNYRHWDTWTDYKHSHIFVAALKDNQLSNAEDIMQNEPFDAPLSPYFDASEMTWSANSNCIAYTCRKLYGKNEALSTNSDIYVYTLENKRTRNISEGSMGYDRYPVFSPNGKMIAWQSMATPGYESDKDRLIVASADGSNATDITSDFDQSVSNINWSDDGNYVYFISGIHATFQIYKAEIATKKITRLTSGWHDYTSLQLKNKTLVGERMSFGEASEIFKIDEKGTETQLTFTNKNIYSQIKLGEVKERWVKTTDGAQMLVWYVLPPNFDTTKKYPAILYCQGGPQSAVSQFFSYRWNLQLMAANGYIVIAPNRRGLPTFGSAWNRQISGDYGGQNIKDYLTSVDDAITLPYIDAQRIGAVGASYGGFSVYYLAGMHQKRFHAFIAHCGMFNLESQYGATEEYFFTNFDLGGAYWANPRPKSFSFSPHRMVQNWDTPIMVITGEYDFRIPYTESLQAFNAAQLRGIPSKLLIFPDENHWVLKPQNSILWQREFFGWLNKWLK